MTTYPAISTHPQTPTPLPDLAGLDLSGMTSPDFRSPPAYPSDAKLILKHLVLGGSLLTPGATETTQREVDIDSTIDGLTRLSFSGLFLTERRISDISTCDPPIIYRSQDRARFSLGVNKVHLDEKGDRWLCADYHLRPISVVQMLEPAGSVMRVELIILSPQDPTREYRQLGFYAPYRTVNDYPMYVN